MSGTLEDIAIKRAPEYANDLLLFKAAMEILKNRNFVSVIDIGVKGLIVNK
jgi:hypothetical protein